ncbi:MAG: hypothetical protein Ct9H300mP1_01170 [Planctomycetaceae bacterium]|nr:MAG: hypothetical protein Ct9H300mP1_01170 [Planctomycetaceae bacterium]
MHAYTYSAHPVGCAVAWPNPDIIEGEDFPGQAPKRAVTFSTDCRPLSVTTPTSANPRAGADAGRRIVEDRGTKQEFAADEKVGARVQQAMQQHGLFSPGAR